MIENHQRFWLLAGLLVRQVIRSGWRQLHQQRPLAWKGLIAWWLLLVSLFIWMSPMSWQILAASHLADN